MSGSIVAIVLIPVVVAVALAAWIVMVHRASRNPHGSDRGGAPDREVSGGIFQGDRRQWMPRRDAPATEADSGTGPEKSDGVPKEERRG